MQNSLARILESGLTLIFTLISITKTKLSPGLNQDYEVSPLSRIRAIMLSSESKFYLNQDYNFRPL